MDQRDHDGRRGERPPRPVAGEVARTALIERLAARFSTAVTTLVAGAGFGKSTALAQAIRHNGLNPVGIDAWVGCGPGVEDSERLTGAIMRALGSSVGTVTGAVDQIVQAVVERSPLDVCIVIDDCHLIPAGSSSESLLDQLVRAMPANGHLVLSGRWLPDVPLARLRARNEVLALTDRDLAFDASEIAVAAERLGRDPGSVHDLGGWPALVRLALAADPGVDRQFLREEVLSGLDPDLRDALLALVVMGPSSASDVAALLGRETDLDALAAAVPMVTVDDAMHYSAHQLWDEAIVAATDPHQVSALRSAAFEMLLGHGELPRAAGVAIADRNWSALGRAALALVRTTLTSLPADTARAWREAVPPEHWQASFPLLDVALRSAADTRDPEIDGLLARAMDDARRTGDLDAEITGIGLAALLAHGRGDFGPLLPLALRVQEIPEAAEDPVVGLIVHALDGAVADLRGDPEAVLAALAPVRWDLIPHEVALTPNRLRVQALWMAGRADESIALAESTLAMVDEDHVRRTPALARWFAGDPSGYEHEGQRIEVEPSFNERDHFVGSCFITVIMASAGSSAEIDALWEEGNGESLAFDNARDSAHLAYTRAVRSVIRGDEEAAAEHFRDHLARYPVTDALGERHLRRWPALGAVLSPELRELWSSIRLGPSHDRAFRCGRALVAARAGRVEGTELVPPQLYTQLPLPWSVELACRWEPHAPDDAHRLVGYLADKLGDRLVDQLNRVTPDLVPAAQRLLAGLPSAPGHGLRIEVLGELAIRRDGVVVESAELRRSRVRQLLSILVIERTARRERLIDLLWPDMSPDSAAGNLRVTLAHLRRLLESDQDSGYHLRTDGTLVSLHRSDHLSVDLWDFEDRAAQLARTGTSLLDQRSLLTELADLWRGEPLTDLVSVGSYSLLADRLRLRHIGALLRLGELNVAEGEPHAALARAEQALALDPYREQAHRLAVAAHLQLDDTVGARRAMERLDAALADLGVEPEPATRILRRQAERRVGG